MDLNQMINEIERQIDEHYLYSEYINENGISKGTLKNLIENNFVKRTGANSSQLVDYIKNKMYVYITPLTDAELKKVKFIKKIDDFIASQNGNFVEYIVNPNGSITNFKEFLLKNFEGGFVNDDNEVVIVYIIPGSQEKRIYKRSLDYLYNYFIEANKKEDELADKLETIDYYTNLLVPKELFGVIYKDGKTFDQFLHEQLPFIMTNGGDVSFVDSFNNEVKLTIDLFIKQETNMLLERLEYEKEAYYNKVNENPLDVMEIDEFGKLPVFEVSDEVKYFNDQLYNIKQSIYNATSLDTLNILSNKFNDLCSSVNNQLVIENSSFVDSINKLIVLKQNNIIKRNNNMSDYINSILEKLMDIELRIENINTHEEFINIFNELEQVKLEVFSNDIHDSLITEKFDDINNLLNIKRFNSNTKMENMNVYHKKSIDNLDILLEEIKSKFVEFELEKNEIKKASIDVKIDSLINEFKSLKNDLYKNELLSAGEANLYSDKLDMILNPQMEGEYFDERRV